jgi:hypothetical protein
MKRRLWRGRRQLRWILLEGRPSADAIVHMFSLYNPSSVLFSMILEKPSTLAPGTSVLDHWGGESGVTFYQSYQNKMFLGEKIEREIQRECRSLWLGSVPVRIRSTVQERGDGLFRLIQGSFMDWPTNSLHDCILTAIQLKLKQATEK